jgi:hypothetical protein
LLVPMVTRQGRVVLYCDEEDETFLSPAAVEERVFSYPTGPGWEVAPGVDLAPGTVRLATEADVAARTDWDLARFAGREVTPPSRRRLWGWRRR